MRPAELYGLRWSDIDIRAEAIHVERQYSATTRSFELPKNGKTHDPAHRTREGGSALDASARGRDAMVFRGKKGAS